MKRILFITAPDAEYGFSLAGMTQYVSTADKLETLLLEALSPEIGMAVIDERISGGIDSERLREIERAWQGIILFLPAPERPKVMAEDYVGRLIRKAIGYQVRLSA